MGELELYQGISNGVFHQLLTGNDDMTPRRIIRELQNNEDIQMSQGWECPRICDGYLDYFDYDGSAVPPNTVYVAQMDESGKITVVTDLFLGNPHAANARLQPMGWPMPGVPQP